MCVYALSHLYAGRTNHLWMMRYNDILPWSKVLTTGEGFKKLNLSVIKCSFRTSSSSSSVLYESTMVLSLTPDDTRHRNNNICYPLETGGVGFGQVRCPHHGGMSTSATADHAPCGEDAIRRPPSPMEWAV